MKPLVVCYSFTGRTKRICGSLAKALKADFVEIREIDRPGIVGAYTLGCFRALRRKSADIRPVLNDIGSYGSMVVAAPVRAGNVPPAMNDFVREYSLEGKTVFGLLTCRGGPGNAAACLREELEKAGAVCPNVLVMESDDETIAELKAGKKVFALKDGLLTLQDGSQS